MSANPLVAPTQGDGFLVSNMSSNPHDSANLYVGTGLLSDTMGIVSDIQSKNWVCGGIDGLGFAADLASAAADPLAALAAAGVGWAIEHVSFLKAPLDWLTGDQNAIAAIGTTWGNIATAVTHAATDLETDTSRLAAHWTGAAATAYQRDAGYRIAGLQSIAGACTGVQYAIELAGVVLNVVRGFVRDLVSQAVGNIIATLIEAALVDSCTLGLATPALVYKVVTVAQEWAGKIAKFVAELVASFRNLRALIEKLCAAAAKVAELFKALRGGSSLPTMKLIADPADWGPQHALRSVPGALHRDEDLVKAAYSLVDGAAHVVFP